MTHLNEYSNSSKHQQMVGRENHLPFTSWHTLCRVARVVGSSRIKSSMKSLSSSSMTFGWPCWQSGGAHSLYLWTFLWAVLEETWKLVAISWELLLNACQARMRALWSSLILANALGLSAFFFPFWHTSQHNHNTVWTTKQHPPTWHAPHCSVLTTLQPFCIIFHQSLASTSPATIRDFRNVIRGFRKKTPTHPHPKIPLSETHSRF